MKNENIKNLNELSLLKCCESGCEDCPFDFNQDNNIDPNYPRELQQNNNNDFDKGNTCTPNKD